MRRGVICAVAAALLALGIGCGSSVVGQSTIETTVSDAIESKTGRAPESVSCPGDLTREVGAEMRCSMVERGSRRGLTIRVTAVTGSDVAVDVVPDRTVEPQ